VSCYGQSIPCQPKEFGYSSFVCVCNGTYCDEYETVENMMDISAALVVTSNEASKRMEVDYVEFNVDATTETNGTVYDYILDETKTFQEILGFGGAFTDSAGINIHSMNDENIVRNIIESYYDPKGLDYSIGRINMGGCDFSVRKYTYADTEGDVELETFALQDEDNLHKIPLVKLAQSLRQDPIRMFASPWNAPAWMKSNHEVNGKGFLLPEFYPAWANYFVKFLDHYKEQGVDFWGLTAQNEPWDGTVPDFTFNAMGWNATTQRDWIVEHLGPALEAAGYADVKLMILDDQRPLVPKWAREVFSDERALKYVDGIGIHWYADEIFVVPFALDQAHEEFPDKFLLYTEACTGDRPWDIVKVMLGDWDRGERYIHNIIEDLNHWVVGWTDWNLALDLQGGPNWAGNFVDAPIIVNPEDGEFYKQPMYYALGHISRFIPPGSVRVGLDVGSNPVQAVAFKRPDNTYAVVLLNRSSSETYAINLKTSKGDLKLNIGPKSFTSLAFNLSQRQVFHLLN